MEDQAKQNKRRGRDGLSGDGRRRAHEKLSREAGSCVCVWGGLVGGSGWWLVVGGTVAWLHLGEGEKTVLGVTKLAGNVE